jgi:hypothetical protein
MKLHVFKNTSRQSQADGVRGGEITAVARASYCEAFGITPAEQVALEAHYDNLVLEAWEKRELGREDLSREFDSFAFVFGRE